MINIRKSIGQRLASREYLALERTVGEDTDALVPLEDPALRAEVLQRQARAVERLAELHHRVWGVEADAESLRRSARLLRIAAAAENALALAPWSRAADLEPGDWIVLDGKDLQVTAVEPSSFSDTQIRLYVTAAAGEPGRMLVMEIDRPLRTHGPVTHDDAVAAADLEVLHLAVQDGAADAELAVWDALTQSRVRAHRAVLYRKLAKLAAGRVGEDAAETFEGLADVELAASQAPISGAITSVAARQMHRQRAVIGAVFFLIGALIAIPAVFAGASPEAVLAMVGLVATAVGAALAVTW